MITALLFIGVAVVAWFTFRHLREGSLAYLLLAYLLLLPFVSWLTIHVHFAYWTLVPTSVVIVMALVAFRTRPVEGPALVAYGLTAVVLMYAGVVLAEVFNPKLASVTLGVRGGRLYLEPILLFFVGAEVARRPELRRRVVTVILLAGGVVVAYALKQGITGFDLKESIYLRRTFNIALKEHRVMGTMNGATVLGHYLALVLLLIAARIMHGLGNAWLRVLEIAVAGACCYGMLLTGQRGVMLAGAAGAVVVTCVGLARSSTKGWAAVVGQGLVVVLFLAVVLAITTPIQDRRQAAKPHQSAFEAARLKFALLKEGRPESSVQGRLNLLSQIRTVADVAPFGVGAGFNLTINPGRSTRATLLGTSGYGSSATTLQPQAGDNYYYILMSELGWPGLALFIAISLFAITTAVRVALRHPDRDKAMIALAAAGFFVFVVLDAFTVDVMSSAQVATYFWLLLGMVGRWRAEDLPGPAPSRAALASAA